MGALRERHDELKALGRQFANLLQRDTAPTAHELGLARMNLSAAVRRYLAEEHAHVIGPLNAIGSPEAKDLVGTFNKQTEDLRRSYSEHIGDWPAGRVEQEWIGYRAASRTLIADMARVAQLKDTSLFQKAAALIERTAARNAA